ncbi:MAG: hypothetical protein CMJ49_13200 [Planctomycetaceae bacterium]|nr:hypothetical protein [Planctomycetaceae bacterium]
MTAFINDADLLIVEPRVFEDLPFAAQQTLRVDDAALAGVTITSVAGGFNTLVIGDVIVLRTTEADAATFAIAGITDDNTLTVENEPTHLTASVGLTMIARTFTPQINIVHAQIMRAMGIDIDDPDEELDEASIVSVSVMQQIETLGTLAQVYAAAVAPVGDNETIMQKADAYARQFTAAMRGARVLIDIDGDGQADVWRTAGQGRLVRV